MPYIFVDDGYPEASEYSNNYIWYDASDPASLESALAKAEILKGRSASPADLTRNIKVVREGDTSEPSSSK